MEFTLHCWPEEANCEVQTYRSQFFGKWTGPQFTALQVLTSGTYPIQVPEVSPLEKNIFRDWLEQCGEEASLER